MFTQQEVRQYLTAVASMAAHPGSYTYLTEVGGQPMLTHHSDIGNVLFEFKPSATMFD